MIEIPVPDEFGIIIPSENADVLWRKQSGGMSCIQQQIPGTFIPFGKMKYNHGWPEWTPKSGTGNFEEQLKKINIKNIPESDYKTFPENVIKRGYFKNYTEFRQWINNSEKYGFETLWDDLYRFEYGIFELLDKDPRNRWNNKQEIWAEINKRLYFEYEEISRKKYKESDKDRNLYPVPSTDAIKLIKITNGPIDKKYNVNWGKLIGEWVYFMYPNAD